MRHLLAALLVVAVPAGAQAPAPYAGMQQRPIKALSADAQADLLAGRGMGLALAAELNGFPGPMHVLELADRLALSPAQRAATEALMARMRADAIRLGQAVVAAEAALDQAFATRAIDAAALARQTAAIAALQGELRAVHLATHLDQAALLTAAQVAAYNDARGYGGGIAPVPGGHHRRH
jgi:Spy/CpxP family protein refolding chaperone